MVLGRLVSTVIKSIALVLFLVMAGTVIWNITTVLSVHYRILGSNYPLVFAVADNNRLTDEIKNSYVSIFTDIAEPGGVPNGTVQSLGFDPATLGTMQAGGSYGDIIKITIKARYGVQDLKNHSVGTATGPFAGLSTADANGNHPFISIPVTYTYWVPCLRYYK